MYELAWPWVLGLLILPVIVAWVVPRAPPARQEALRFPFVDQLARLGSLRRPARRGWRQVAASAAWCLLVIAAARPQSVGEPLSLPLTGRDMLVAIDLSTSMSERDLRIDGVPMTRLAVVQHVLGEFIARREGDRVGLIVFGTAPYVMVPLTFDRTMVRQGLEQTLVGMAGTYTALGDVIGLAVKRLSNEPAAKRVLILVSDGANTGGNTHPLDAAEVARAARLTVHVIGVGTKLTVAQQRALGSNVLGRSLDEPTLRAIAQRTGGKYFRADALETLDAISTEIDVLEPSARPSEIIRPVQEHYPRFVLWALALSVLVLFASRVERVAGHLNARTRAILLKWRDSSS